MTINESTVDWLIWPVDADPQWASLVGAQPDLVEIARDAVAKSGVNPDDIDEIALVQWLLGLFAAFCETMLIQLDRPEDLFPLQAILTRQDLRLEYPWNYLTWLGPTGVAMHSELAELLSSDDVQAMLTNHIANGEFRHRLRPVR